MDGLDTDFYARAHEAAERSFPSQVARRDIRALLSRRGLASGETWRALRNDTGPGWVYFAEANGCDRVKIGWTSVACVARRIASLQTGCPFPIRLITSAPGSVKVEARLHRMFTRYRVSPSTEWFLLRDELRQFVDAVTLIGGWP